MTLLSSIENIGQKLLQLWIKINVVTVHKVVETMQQQMGEVIKAKGGPTKYLTLFRPGSVHHNVALSLWLILCSHGILLLQTNGEQTVLSSVGILVREMYRLPLGKKS